MATTNSYTVEHVAAALHVKPRTLAEWRKAEQGPPWAKFGMVVIYPAAEFEAWFDSQIRRPGQSRSTAIAPDHAEASVQ